MGVGAALTPPAVSAASPTLSAQPVRLVSLRLAVFLPVLPLSPFLLMNKSAACAHCLHLACALCLHLACALAMLCLADVRALRACSMRVLNALHTPALSTLLLMDESAACAYSLHLVCALAMLCFADVRALYVRVQCVF